MSELRLRSEHRDGVCDVEGCGGPAVATLSYSPGLLPDLSHHEAPQGVHLVRVCSAHQRQILHTTMPISMSGRQAPPEPLFDLGPLPKTHPREAVVTQASRELAEAFREVCDRHGLTVSERVLLVTQILEQTASTSPSNTDEQNARIAWVERVMHLSEPEQRAAIGQLLVDLLDVTEQTDLGEAMCVVEKVFVATGLGRWSRGGR